MSRAATWMPFYVGDYLADTGRLTTTGHGAYMLLIMDYWRNGPLPDDDEILATIARLSKRAWKKLRDTVRSFFQPEDGKLRHRRIDAEMEKTAEISDKRREAASSRRPKPEPQPEPVEPTDAPADAPVLHDVCSPFADGLHDDSRARASLQSQSQLQRRKRTPPNPPAEAGGSVGAVDDVYFQMFIDQYPRQKAVDAARRAWQARLAEGVDPQEILAGLQRFEFSNQVDKIPYPANWLRAGQWRDVPDSAVTGGWDPVLTAVGLKPADFASCTEEERTMMAAMGFTPSAEQQRLPAR